uniref:HIVEP zinc finger 3a n=1 Tax=Poecilia formosa TaxID=48698 RepID=A0A087XB20_POEFO
ASETQEDNPKQKRERKPQKPGKYVCTYCGRACAKPSVLQKHIRSHTGERPYPCAPCGFSFKTKSNLYKHRKSHTHKVKAGLAFGEPKSLEEQVTESEDETRHLSSASALTNRQNSVASVKNPEVDVTKDRTGPSNDSFAVKKRLALRLSRGKHCSQDSSDEKTSSLILGSRGSTESGYFSRSESTEQPQDSPTNTSAKSYAEIILGKYGRLGQLQRMSRYHDQNLPGHEEKNISFSVPKKQVIDHITKLITINEAVVDTSKIDSVKPRRFSLTRKNSSEAQKSPSIKEPIIHSPKSGNLGMGVPCEKFHHASLKVEQPSCQISSASMVRSLSMPSASSSLDTSSAVPCKFRQTQSFDEKPSETQTPRRFGTLRRQPAIEIPVGSEPTKEEQEMSHTFSCNSVTTVSGQRQRQPQPYECEACGTGCKDWEGYKKHKQNLCHAHYPQNEMVMSPMESSQLSNHVVRAGVSTMRKRRKEESFDSDDLSLSPSALSSGQCKDEAIVAVEGPRRPALQTCSVIQHTSLFEKQESSCYEYQKNRPISKTQPQHQSVKPTSRKLVRQNNVQVPEILVTEDLNICPDNSKEPNLAEKKMEKLDDFHWPQRSPSLAQLPIEKLPPKKKRLRLAEAAQSSGDSSFDSMSLPRSPSQDSSASYASSRSTSFEEPSRPDMEIMTSTALRRSRAPHMLTVPGVHHQREMRRSASEQAPHDPQPSVEMAETRSKSFDYSCLSPERSAVGWKERRRCLLMRHAVIRDQDDEVGHATVLSHSPEHVSSDRCSQGSQTTVYGSRSSSPPLSSVRVLGIPEGSQCKEILTKWKFSQNINLKGSAELSKSYEPSVDVIKEASYIHPEQVPPRVPQTNPSYGPSGAARAHYLPVSTGLKLEIPPQHQTYAEGPTIKSHIQQRTPHITYNLEELRPFTSPAIAVRLQTDTLTPGCAIYTTLSQSVSQRPHNAFNGISPKVCLSTAELRNHPNTSLDLQSWSEDGPRCPGSSSNKRMLSPSNSIELNPESQQQQKRVKEEEEKEVGCANISALNTQSQELKQETLSCLPDVSSPASCAEPSYPSLLSSTCNSWCYLNYIKPNPSTLDEQEPSVYSSWSTSGYDPNPPGLCSKTVLSLLHCKQRLTSSIYTTSSMTVRITESMEDEDCKRLCSTEIFANEINCIDFSNKSEVHSRIMVIKDELSTQKPASRKRRKDKSRKSVYASETNSHLKSGYLKGGWRGSGLAVCTNCFCSCSKKNKVVHKYIPARTQVAILSSRGANYFGMKPRCNIAFYMFATKHYRECQEHRLSDEKLVDSIRSGTKATSQRHFFLSAPLESKDQAADPDQLEDSDRQDAAHEDDDGTHDEGSGSTVPDGSHTRGRLNASSSGASHSPHTQSPGPEREPSPPRSPSPGPHPSPAPTSSLSPSSHPVSSVLKTAASPVRGPAEGSHSTGFPGSPAGGSAPCQTCRPQKELRPAAALINKTNSGPPTNLGPGSVPHRGIFQSSWPENWEAGERLEPQSGDESSLVPIIGPHPARPRGTNRLLSHLPLHSQQPGRTPSLLIPIGGIHMVQPRSTLPLYRLVASPAASHIPT